MFSASLLLRWAALALTRRPSELTPTPRRDAIRLYTALNLAFYRMLGAACRADVMPCEESWLLAEQSDSLDRSHAHSAMQSFKLFLEQVRRFPLADRRACAHLGGPQNDRFRKWAQALVDLAVAKKEFLPDFDDVSVANHAHRPRRLRRRSCVHVQLEKIRQGFLERMTDIAEHGPEAKKPASPAPAPSPPPRASHRPTRSIDERRDSRDYTRETRDTRDDRRDSRDYTRDARDARDGRDAREGREGREGRDWREGRDERDTDAAPVERTRSSRSVDMGPPSRDRAPPPPVRKGSRSTDITADARRATAAAAPSPAAAASGSNTSTPRPAEAVRARPAPVAAPIARRAAPAAQVGTAPCALHALEV
jgi:hypothetical protein